MIYELVPGAAAEYARLHEAVPEAVRDALVAQGLSDYSIWVYGDLVVSSYRERATDWSPSPEVQRELDAWSARLAPLFLRVVEADGAPMAARRVFRLD
ncbi:hypothetical protein GCM10009857_09240 [Agromyces soli]